MKLLIIDLPGHDAKINLGLEDDLLHLKDGYYGIRFWMNSAAVILGKFQKHEFEINQEFLQNKSIPFFYRNTGGGTVYHDEGNLNISFIKSGTNPLPGHENAKVSTLITELICDTIRQNDADFVVSKRNAIYFQDKKLLGSAVSMTQGKFLYHASLLVNSKLENLQNCINWNPQYPADSKKLVKSERDPVINLAEIYPVTIDNIKVKLVENAKILLKPKKTIFISDPEHLEFYLN
ncbi:MAG: lipoate--protein ligase family protein [Calditrichaeota bacterium]|nr:MAG: lipoate--protein ligase family protein [Calditrichota bacterium]